MRFGDGKWLTAAELDVPPHVAGLSSFLAAHCAAWRDGLHGLREPQWRQSLGPGFGRSPTRTRSTSLFTSWMS